jgi:hypothetical protein
MDQVDRGVCVRAGDAAGVAKEEVLRLVHTHRQGYGQEHAGSDGLKRSVGAAMNADTRPGAHPRTPLAAAMLISSPWTRPPIQAGRHGLATVHPSTCTRRCAGPGAKRELERAWRSLAQRAQPARTAAARPHGSIIRDGGTVFVLRRRWLRFEQPRVAAPWGPCPKVWPPCSFSNKEPSKTKVWLPCSGHVQEQ